jgi:hypothetical protein
VVALRDDLLDRVGAVREGAAQVGAGAGKALVACVRGEMLDAAAPALVIRRQHRAHGVRPVLGALRLLEAAHHRGVALQV